MIATNFEAGISLIAPLRVNFISTPLYYRVTQDDDTLHEVADLIASRNSNWSDYHPQLAVVLTVQNAMFSSNGSDNEVSVGCGIPKESITHNLIRSCWISHGRN